MHWARLVADLGVEAEFDVAMSSHQLGLHKPDAAIFSAALERPAVPAAHVLFFEDAVIDVETASAAGMQAAMVDGPDAIRRELERRGLWV